MGTLRFLFALSILIFHSGQFFNYNVANRTIAVLSFFIISGFYMGLILDKKYTDKRQRFLFWSNRFLRIFPLYWATLLITFFFAAIKLVIPIGAEDNAIIHYINWAPHTSPIDFSLNLINYVLRNITLIVTADYVHANDSTPGYLLVQQAWSLQVELLFYLLAPFLARLSTKAFLSFFFIYVIGFFGFILPSHIMQSTLIDLFFSNLIFFLLGMMSYRFLYKFLQTKKIHPHIPRFVFIIFLIYLLAYSAFAFDYPIPSFNISDPLYYVVLVVSLPLIFLQTSASILDNFIGKFSYPVYVLHFFIIKLFSNIPLFKIDSNFKTILIILATLVVSYLAIKFIETPIDRYRQSRVVQ